MTEDNVFPQTMRTPPTTHFIVSHGTYKTTPGLLYSRDCAPQILRRRSSRLPVGDAAGAPFTSATYIFHSRRQRRHAAIAAVGGSARVRVGGVGVRTGVDRAARRRHVLSPASPVDDDHDGHDDGDHE